MNKARVTMSDLSEMTWGKWISLSEAERARLRDRSDLSSQLKGLERCRVEVIDKAGDKPRRFIVGLSTGWKPIHLEIARRNSRGGPGASKVYHSVRYIERVR